MLDEYGFDLGAGPTVPPEKVVTGVFSHPLHGRLIERVILWVRPHINYGKARYKLTWWGNGVAYYRAIPSAMESSEERGHESYRRLVFDE